ncbi:MAG TPA: hypothetical protein VKR06_28505 [Ktedonosporobacter sp.]|nr:hypothetical protein [Ktedonosporobacter sp.]
MDEEKDQQWQKLSEQILTDIKEWRRAHPKATFREIEDEVHARMSRLEAQVLQDSAQASSSREWSGASAQARPECPVCGTGLQARGKQVRKLQGVGGQEISLTRSYGTCPTCGTGLFPPR